MIRFIIEKDNVNVAFDAPTDLLYDRLAFLRVGDIPISGTENASVRIIPWADVKLAEVIAKRFSDDDKISEVNALCEKVKYMQPSDEKAFIERLENEMYTVRHRCLMLLMKWVWRRRLKLIVMIMLSMMKSR